MILRCFWPRDVRPVEGEVQLRWHGLQRRRTRGRCLRAEETGGQNKSDAKHNDE